MKTRPLLALPLIFLLVVSVAAQTQTPAPKTPPAQTQQSGQPGDDEVVRITTNLVQMDVVVTDKKGKIVTDLRPEEIEVYEDGRLQNITNFSFISTEGGAARTVAVKPAASVDKLAPPVPPVRLRPDQVRRTIALVVDDLGLSFESTGQVRQALRKFVDRDMQPGDLVAIIRTAGGIGALQQFTSDKRQLHAAIERVKYYLSGRGGTGAFAPLQGLAPSAQDGSSIGGQNETGIVSGDDPEQFREDLYAVGTLGAINYVIRGMRELPGRKSIMVMSDGLNLGDTTRRPRVFDAARRLVDQAARASVVIYTMDARGLQTLGLNASDDVAGFSGPQIQQQIQMRRRVFSVSQDGFKYLAEQTGGFSIINDNDLSGGIRRVLDDQKGYYLIGYRPDESTFNTVTGRRQFHKISFKLKRPGLNVRSRPGFFGVTNEEAIPQRRTRAGQLLAALTSPFASAGVNLRLTPLFGNDPKTGSFVRVLLHINARDLTFTDEPDGWHKAVFDIFAVTFGDNGTVVDQLDRIHTVRVRGGTYKRALENGFVFNLTVPIKKPGAYQLRTALRDTTSERVGSASQFIEVPNITKNRLLLSGIVINGNYPGARNSAAAKDPAGEARAPEAAASPGAEEEIGDSDPHAGPAVRTFRSGMLLRYDYIVYNAQLNKALGRSQVETQMRLFRDGREIFAGRVEPLEMNDQTDLKRLVAGGAFQLGTNMTPGEYILQIIATDPLAKTKYRVATQWIDFEIVK